jgi:hypothetical protein
VKAELVIEIGADVTAPEAEIPAPRRRAHRQAGCAVAVSSLVTDCT